MNISLQGITHRISISASDAEIQPGDAVPPKLESLFAYWSAKKGSRLAPARDEIQPDEIVGILPFVMLIDCDGPTRRLRYRLVGSEIERIFGAGLTGRFLDEVDFNGLRPLVVADYMSVILDAEPSWTRWKFLTGAGRLLEYERIALPLSADGRRVNMILVGVVGAGLAPLKGMPLRSRGG